MREYKVASYEVSKVGMDLLLVIEGGIVMTTCSTGRKTTINYNGLILYTIASHFALGPSQGLRMMVGGGVCVSSSSL